MAITIHVDIVSAEAQIFSGLVELAVATTVLGEVGMMAGHAQLLAELKPGPVRLVLPDGKEQIFYVSGGILEVQPFGITILADTALRAEDLDEAAALEAKKKAELALQERRGEFEYSKAAASLAEALAQIQAIQKIRKRYKV